ncbi:MAG: 4-hydroxy-tetrahydrodipicolinate synthase [bacterium]
MFEGTYVAIVTDFRNGQVDYDAFAQLAERLIEAGVDGLVPAGCTGEAATLSVEERRKLVKTLIDLRGKRKFKIIPGAGTNSTASTIDLSKMCEDLGADGVLLITPYYNKPTQAGLVKHYEAVASRIRIPIMLYNVPGRTGVSMLPETVAELSKVDNIVAIKEASGSVDQVSRILELCSITVLSGDDSLTLPMMAVGARGVVSVAANIMPREMVEMVSSFLRGEIDRARDLHMKMLPLMHILFVETNPCPVKAALKMMGHGTGELRLPLVEVTDSSASKIRQILLDLELIR